jgi:Peptidase family M48
MSDPVKPETRERIVDENLSGKRRRPTTQAGMQAGARSNEGVPAPTATDSTPPLGVGLDARLMSAPAPSAPPIPPSKPASTPPRFAGPLDPSMPSPQEASGARPRPRESSTSGPRPRAAELDPALPPPEAADAKRASESIPRPKKKKKPLNPMIGAVGGVVVVVVLVVGSLLPGVAARSTSVVAPAVPDMVSIWGGRAEVPSVQSYVSRVAATVASKSVAVPTVSVYVAQDPAPHALALPGHEIVISAGLLRRLASEAQLAAVIAHLIAHQETGDVDKAFLEGKDADLRTRARTAATTPYGLDAERRAALRTGELLQAAGYVTSAFPDAHGALSARSGRMSSFVQQHPVPQDALTSLRTAAEGGRAADADYARNALDPLGRAAAAPAEPAVNPPLPPKPPATPKLDMSRPSDRVKRDGVARPPPRKKGATSEPPAPPL